MFYFVVCGTTAPGTVLSHTTLAACCPDTCHSSSKATWLAVVIIFLISGLGLHTSDFGNVILNKKFFNVFVQVYNFGIVSAIVYWVSKTLERTRILPPELATGMIICSCLPMAVNATIVLTGAANGSEAAAIFHSTLGNIVGIFLSPLLIRMYLPGASGDTKLTDVFLDLFYRVLTPLMVGQFLKHFSASMRAFYAKYKRYFKKTQESCLIFIV
jgi:sodium/bile acid cotransporter 7